MRVGYIEFSDDGIYGWGYDSYFGDRFLEPMASSKGGTIEAIDAFQADQLLVGDYPRVENGVLVWV